MSYYKNPKGDVEWYKNPIKTLKDLRQRPIFYSTIAEKLEYEVLKEEFGSCSKALASNYIISPKVKEIMEYYAKSELSTE